MKRYLGIALAAAATLALTVVLNLGIVAGFPWSEAMYR